MITIQIKISSDNGMKYKKNILMVDKTVFEGQDDNIITQVIINSIEAHSKGVAKLVNKVVHSELYQNGI